MPAPSTPEISRLDGASTPFGLYLHVPFCATRCGYCDFNTYTAGELGSSSSPESWLAAVLGPAHAHSGRLLARGRAAFVLCDGARWGARVITTPGALSLEQLRCLRTAVPVPTPRPLPTTMPEQQVVLWPLGELVRRWWRAGAPGVSVSR